MTLKPSCAAACLLLICSSLSAEEKGPFGGFKHDNTEAIEITSDNLEVRQAEQLAIFTGDVIAGQGTLRLTADQLDVFYKEKNDDAPDTGTADTDTEAAGTGAIERLIATGNVFLSNGTETAQGERGVYDVKTGIITMEGSVILAQGENAISGPKLEIDLNTGVGKVLGGENSRVKSVFTPSSTDEDN
ncbi:MAG: lipopolysaccharide transport periplasmic protein LptA [Pseudomonadota bacterium]